MFALDRIGQKEASHRLRQLQMQVMQRQLELVPEDVRARVLLAAGYADSQRAAEADRELQIAIALRPKDANILYNAACVYGILQKKTEALALLKRAKDAGLPNLGWADKDPDLACLHGDPEFERLLAESRKDG